MGQRFLILSASMGAGHDAVAGELARRLRAEGHAVTRRDVLELLPPGTGPALRGFYRACLRHSPWLYGALYPAFFGTGPGPHPGSAPLAALVERRLLDAVSRWRPDAVVSTFHLAAQATGRLRAGRALCVPSAVVVTDFAVHRQWLHPGNDLHLCVTENAAVCVRQGGGRSATAPGPVVPPAFQTAGQAEGPSRWTREFALRAPGRVPVLLSAGAWGVGSALESSALLLARSGYLPVLLCGHDERLLHRSSRLPGVFPVGWVEDMAGLMSSSRALVDNAAGQTAVQALAAGLPVVGYRPIPGHGVQGVREMTAAGLAEYSHSPGDLLRTVGALVRPGPFREQRVTAGRAAFKADTARLLSSVG